MNIFEKDYDGESLYDLNRDIHEAFESDFNPTIDKVPTDEYGIHKGTFKVTIVWSEENE